MKMGGKLPDKLGLLMVFCLFGHPHSFCQTSGVDTQGTGSNSLREKTGQISGRVLRSDTGAPVSKVVVTIWRAAQARSSFSVRTDSSGAFLLKQVDPGTYRLRAQKGGFIAKIYGQRGSGPGTTIGVEAGETLKDILFRLDPAGAVSGNVFDEDRDPVEGLTVAALRLRFFPGGLHRAEVIRSTTTDDRGEYRLAGLAPGSYLLQAGGRGEAVAISTLASAFSYASAFYPSARSELEATRVQLSSGEEARGIDITVRTTPTFSVSGLIIDSSPLGAARQYSVGFARAGGTALTPADPNGSFSLRGLEPGEYTIVGRVAEDGRPPRQGFARLQVVDSDVRAIIDTGSAVEMRGKARFEDESELNFNGLRVLLVSERDGDPAVTGSFTEVGGFAIRNIPTGAYYVQVIGRSDEAYLKRIECGAEDFSLRAITLDRGNNLDDCTILLSSNVGTVAGKVADDDKPSEGMVVVLIPRQLERRKIPRHTMVAQSDAYGQFQIKGVIPGEYLVFAVPPSDDSAYYTIEFPERNSKSSERITVKQREAVTISLKTTKPI